MTSAGSSAGSSRSLQYDPVTFPPERIAERISRAKNDLLTAEAFRQARQERIGDLFDSVVDESLSRISASPEGIERGRL